MELEQYQNQFKEKKEQITQAAEALSQYLGHARALAHNRQTQQALRKGRRHAHKALDLINQAESVPKPRPRRRLLSGLAKKDVDLSHPEPELGGSFETDLTPESDQLSSG